MDCSFERMGVAAVLAGTSASRRDQPMELKESRNDADAMFGQDARAATSGSKQQAEGTKSL